MTTPTLFASGYDANSLYRAPVKRDGTVQNIRSTASAVAGTANAATIGLVPFTAGAKVCMRGSSVYVGDGDTATTATAAVGWIYDDAVTYTSNTAGFAAANTAPQAGGVIPLDASTGYTFVAAAPGWIVLLIGGETVEVTYTVVADILVSYN